MSCAFGFDPFGDLLLERSAAFEQHLDRCPACRDVVRVLGAARGVWQDASRQDSARGVFREQRLWRGRGALRARGALASAAIFFALGVTSAWAFGALRLPWRAAGAERPVRVPDLVSPAPPRGPGRDVPAPATPWSEVPTAASSADTPPEPPVARAKVATPTELWERGVARLEHGDRSGAARLFQQVVDAEGVDGALRHRAMFRVAELELATGDTTTPPTALWELVRGDDSAMAFDAALLLERCIPAAEVDRRVSVWDALLAGRPDEPLRREAARRRAQAASPAP